MTTSHDPGDPLRADPVMPEAAVQEPPADLPTFSSSSSSTGSSAGGGAKEQAKQAAGTAADEGSHVAGVAKDEVQQVAAEAKDKAGDLIAEARTQVGEQASTQLHRLADKLNELSDEIDSMVESSSAGGTVSDLARQLSSRTRDLSNHLSQREPADLIDDVRHYARRRSGTFLVGSAVAGVLAGRLTRGAKEAQSPNTGSTSGHGTTQYGTTPRNVGAGSYDTGSFDAGTRFGDTTGASADAGYPTTSQTYLAPGAAADESGLLGAHGDPTDPLAGEPRV